MTQWCKILPLIKQTYPNNWDLDCCYVAVQTCRAESIFIYYKSTSRKHIRRLTFQSSRFHFKKLYVKAQTTHKSLRPHSIGSLQNQLRILFSTRSNQFQVFWQPGEYIKFRFPQDIFFVEVVRLYMHVLLSYIVICYDKNTKPSHWLLWWLW